ncbi:MAG: ribosomal protein S18-alanine N-acetyltransferase [Rickettsiales bacterium]|jgi:ribosomal-protein-alanine N-acetyltransferase|nr:ribosomal protein S18-alanine N-acetyltransferase [Rickettsiales bacterium]
MLKQIANLHKSCFPDRPWSESDFADLQKSGCEIIASENGFIVWRTVADETEIITIGVAPHARRSGIAAAMLALIERDITGVRSIFLEVAADNDAAIRLYESNGFVKIAVRGKYYDGKTDAIVMRKTLKRF